MKKTIVSIILIFIAGFAYADTFNIGGKEIVVPPPKGFTSVTREMDAVYRLSLQMVDPNNDQLAYYISDSDVPTAMNGEMPLLERYFILKVNKQLKNMVIDFKNFTELKNVTKQQNKQILESIKSKIPGLMKDASEGISKEFDVDVAMNISQMIPLGPHYETDDVLSYSMYINYGVTVEGNNQEVIVSSTLTFANVAGKLLFLYCYGPKDKLQWTQSASKSWVQQIMKKNPKSSAR